MPVSVDSLQQKNFPYKDCSIKNRQGGLIAFSPENSITKSLAAYFQGRGENVKFFENEMQMTDYILADNYLLDDEQGNRRQICFAVTFPQFDTGKNQYEYNLRFNITNPTIADHVDAR